MTSKRKKEGSFFLETFCGVVVLLLSLLDAVTSEAWLSDRACQLKRTNPKGKTQEQACQSRAFQIPRIFSFLCLTVAFSKHLVKENRKQGKCTMVLPKL